MNMEFPRVRCCILTVGGLDFCVLEFWEAELGTFLNWSVLSGSVWVALH